MGGRVGVVALRLVGAASVTVASRPPIETFMPAAKPSPVMITGWLPAAGPCAGVIVVMRRSGGSYRYALLAMIADPFGSVTTTSTTSGVVASAAGVSTMIALGLMFRTIAGRVPNATVSRSTNSAPDMV